MFARSVSSLLPLVLLMSSAVNAQLEPLSELLSAAAAASATPTSSVAVASSIAATSTLPPPSLIMNVIPTVTACGSQHVSWNVYNEDSGLYQITLGVLNINVDQRFPTATPSSSAVASASATSSSSAALAGVTSLSVGSSSSSSATPSSSIATSSSVIPSPTISSAALAFASGAIQRRYASPINKTLVVQPANQTFLWTPISLPQGRYKMIGYLSDAKRSMSISSVFSVVQGTDVSCLSAYGIVANTSSSASNTATSHPAASASTQSTAKHGLSTGAIVGIVVGVVGGLVLLLLAVLYLRRRKSHKARIPIGAPEMGERGGGGGNRHRTQFSETSHEGSGEGLVDPGAGGGRIHEAPIIPVRMPLNMNANPFATPNHTPRTEYYAMAAREEPRVEDPDPPSPPNGARGRTDSESAPTSSSHGLSRGPSSRRKPVPVLGPEISAPAPPPTESGNAKERRKSSYNLVVDPPAIVE